MFYSGRHGHDECGDDLLCFATVTFFRPSDSSKNHVPHIWNHSELTPCSMDEQAATRLNDWIDITRPDCATWASRRRVLSALYVCLRLQQSVPTVCTVAAANRNWLSTVVPGAPDVFSRQLYTASGPPRRDGLYGHTTLGITDLVIIIIVRGCYGKTLWS